ncbi:MAG: hypothetical protein LBN04_00535 [Oscillospiraceae bacterium]|nr:hypothetical protein [Oscillospiraceae bacterium]
MKRLCVVLLAMLMLCVAGFAARGEEMRYYNEKYGLSLPIPEGWVQVPVSAEVADTVALQLQPAGGEGFVIRVSHYFLPDTQHDGLSPVVIHDLDIRDLPAADLAAARDLPESAITSLSLGSTPYYQIDLSELARNGYGLLTFQNGIGFAYLFFTDAPGRDTAFEAYYADFLAMMQRARYSEPNPSPVAIFERQLSLLFAAAIVIAVLVHFLLPKWITLFLFRKTNKDCTLAVLAVNIVLWRIVFSLLTLPDIFHHPAAYALSPDVSAYLIYIGIYAHIAASVKRAETRKKTVEHPPVDAY